jgi:hypothetical protein
MDRTGRAPAGNHWSHIGFLYPSPSFNRENLLFAITDVI